MESEPLIKLIQDWTNRIPLIILGSGASVPFNLPSMWTLGEHIKNSLSFVDIKDLEQFEEFKQRFDSCGDLEATLLDINIRPNVLNEIVVKTWQLISKYDLAAYLHIWIKHTKMTLSGQIKKVPFAS